MNINKPIKPNGSIEVVVYKLYERTKKLNMCEQIIAYCEPERKFMFDGMGVKQAPNGDRYFAEISPNGKPIKNINDNRGISMGKMITGKSRMSPIDGNHFNFMVNNWIESSEM